MSAGAGVKQGRNCSCDTGTGSIGLLGLVLIVAPYVGKFAQDTRALSTDVVVGLWLLAWALVGFLRYGRLQTHGMQHTHA